MQDLAAHIRESILDTTDTDFDPVNDALKDVKVLDDNVAFGIPGLEDLEELVIPEGINTITFTSFSNIKGNLTNLRKVTLPSTLKKIEAYTFAHLGSLREVRWSGSPKACTIGRGAFTNCDNLEVIDLPEGITKIDRECFNACKSLREIIIPASTRKIGKSAFNLCRSLEKVTIAPGKGICKLNELADDVFNSCCKLKEIVLPPTIKYIGSFAFHCCTSLESVEALGVNTIGEFTFVDCTKLKIIQFDPAGVELRSNRTPAVYTFNRCSNLITIKTLIKGDIPECVFSGCRNLVYVHWDGKGNIEEGAFKDCGKLANIYVYSNEVTKDYIRDKMRPLSPNIIYK